MYVVYALSSNDPCLASVFTNRDRDLEPQAQEQDCQEHPFDISLNSGSHGLPEAKPVLVI